MSFAIGATNVSLHSMDQLGSKISAVSALCLAVVGCSALIADEDDPFGLRLDDAPAAEPDGDGVPVFDAKAAPPPKLITKTLFIPDSTYTPEWNAQRMEQNAANAGPDPFCAAFPDPGPRTSVELKDYMMAMGVTFPLGTWIKVEADPSPRYDRLSICNSLANVTYVQAILGADCGLQKMSELHLARQSELLAALRHDPRNMEELDYSELDGLPLLEFLLTARTEAASKVGAYISYGSHGWHKLDAYLEENPKSANSLRIVAIETALAAELDRSLEKLRLEQKRVALFQRELDEISKRASDGE